MEQAIAIGKRHIHKGRGRESSLLEGVVVFILFWFVVDYAEAFRAIVSAELGSNGL